MWQNISESLSVLIKTLLFWFCSPKTFWSKKNQNISLKTPKWDISALQKAVIAGFDSQNDFPNAWMQALLNWSTMVPTGGSSVCHDPFHSISPIVSFTSSRIFSENRFNFKIMCKLLCSDLRNTWIRAWVLCWVGIHFNSSLACCRAEASSF